ncbi:MAG: ubiquitin-like domain-containing protein [Sphaerimonospora mesophila]
MGRLLGYISAKVHHIRRVELVFLAVALVLVGLGLLSRNVFADSNTNSSNHVITIYDNEAEKTIVSPADTVAEALADANISLSNYDAVDPGLNEKIVNGSNVITIRRARPIVVHDGSREIRVITAVQTDTEIAAAAGIKVYAEDRVKLAPVDDILAAGGAGLTLTINRAKVVNLRLYGQEMQVRTQSLTVADFLREKNIKLGSDDGMNLVGSTAITNQLDLQIWRNGIQTITATETIPFDTKTVRDATMKIGYRQVQTQGQAGEKTVIYQIEMRDNQEVSRAKISEVVNVEAVQQVEIIGTKVDLPPGSHTDWMAAAGIAVADYGYVEYIIAHESGWGVTKANYTGSGAYGLCQALPGKKMASAGSDWATNPITQLRWCNGYAIGRYGSWAKAYDFWIQHKWW